MFRLNSIQISLYTLLIGIFIGEYLFHIESLFIYLPLYITALFLIKYNYVFVHQNFKILLLFILFFLIYSIILRGFNVAAFKYFLIWNLNILVAIYFYNLLLKDSNLIGHFYKLLFYIAIIGIAMFIITSNDTSNPFQSLINVNSYQFILFVAMILSLEYGNKKDKYFLALAIVLTFSRAALIFLLFFTLASIKNKKSLVLYMLLAFVIILPFVVIIKFDDLVSGFQMLGNFFTLVMSMDTETLELLLKTQASDKDRLILWFAGVDIIIQTFPLGTGLGISNYTHFFRFEDLIGREGGRAHNVLISYIAEFGIFVVVLFYFIFYKIFVKYNINKQYVTIYWGIFCVLLFSEYLTSPYFWIIYSYTLFKTNNIRKKTLQ